jgi:hypothetical protein
MGLRSFLGITPKLAAVDAQLKPAVMGERGSAQFGGFFGSSYLGAIMRADAMTVPAMARARNLICGVIATIPLELFDKKTGEKIKNAPPWVDQPDTRQPRSSTIAWTVDSLLFYPTAFWEVVSIYTDNRPMEMRWVGNDRVTTRLNNIGNEVVEYLVDGLPRPWDGVGSLVTIPSVFGEGILATGSPILRQCIDVQNAAAIAASTPMPTGHLKNIGADIPPSEVEAMKATWDRNRKTGSTAYLNSVMEYVVDGFSPKDMLYNEAIQFQCTQIARLTNLAAFWLDADVLKSTVYQNRVDVRKDLVDLSLKVFISSIEDRLSMDDITPRGTICRFAIDETFLRNDPMTRLEVIEKMLALEMIDLDEAKKMENLADSGDTPKLKVVPNQNDATVTQIPMQNAMGDE